MKYIVPRLGAIKVQDCKRHRIEIMTNNEIFKFDMDDIDELRVEDFNLVVCNTNLGTVIKLPEGKAEELKQAIATELRSSGHDFVTPR